MHGFIRVLITLMATVLIAGACGGDDGGDSGGQGSDTTPTPTPTPSALLSEDFESSTTAFETGTDGNAEISVEDGRLKLYSEDSEAESIAPLSEPVDALTFDIDFEMGESRESLDAGVEDWFGIGCASGDDVYLMLAGVDGTFFLFSRKDGDYEQITDNYKQSFQPTTGDEHQLSAACTNDGSGAAGMSLFIDDKEVITGADAKNPIGPFDGVAVFGQQDESDGDTAFSTFLFDNAEVQPLEM